MWKNWNLRNRPPINYQESDSEEEDYESPNKSPSEFLSPRRPRQAGSPIEGDLTSVQKTDETLAEVNYKLATTPKYIPDPDRSVVPEQEEVVEQLIVQEASSEEVGQEPDPANQEVMAPPAVVNFEDENGVDDAGAFKDACAKLDRLTWNQEDLALDSSILRG